MKKLVTGAAILAATAVTSPAQAVDVEISANGGFVTEYVFRGIPQSNGKAVAQGGLDLEAAGFYLGTWASQVDTTARSGAGEPIASGLEVDFYGGYAFEVGDFGFGIGGTAYTYTEDFDEEYYEVNLSAGWKFITLDYAIGQYDAPTANSSSQDYTFGSVTLDYAGFYGLVGFFGDDFDGTYYEIGYGNTLSVGETELFDYSFALIRSDDDLSFKQTPGGVANEETFFIFGISKSFDLFSN